MSDPPKDTSTELGPAPVRPMANQDYPVEDQPARITFREVNPQQEGTAQAFGGTAGVIQAPPPDTLPDVPMSEANLKVDQVVPGSPEQIYMPHDVALKNLAVLNKNTTFTLDDYQKVMLGKERQKLQDFSDQANYDLQRTMESRRFYNLSLAEIAEKTVLTVIAVFVDILNFFSPEQKKEREDLSYQETANRFANIFVVKERMIYVGVFLVLLSSLFMVVFLSS